jgi:hypothetical protein
MFTVVARLSQLGRLLPLGQGWLLLGILGQYFELLAALTLQMNLCDFTVLTLFYWSP